MRLHSSLRRLLGLAIVSLAAIAPTSALAHEGGAGSVYTESNATANAVQVFTQAPDGTLTPGASYLTGGAGTGAAGLGSEGALAIQRGWLLAVNAGSNDVSAFSVRGDHLVLVNRVPSGGTTPNSVTVQHGVVYVLNAGGTGNISGFLLGRHGLVPLSGSTQPLSDPAAGAVQVSFTPRGDQLVVSEKAANTIVTYPVDRSGRAGAGTPHASAGAAPFGFAFGKNDSLLVTEAAASALTSYQLDPFAPITASLVNGGGAACWAASTGNGRYVYTANAASDSISGYSVAGDGALSLLTPGGATAQLATGTHPLDEAVSHDRFLYVNGGNTGQISAFKIGWNGSLTPLGSFGALPAGFGGLVVGS
jgi:6-phosphogluconolactonase (cycloisomerase 2 family)